MRLAKCLILALFVAALATMVVFATGDMAMAVVRGQCANCHTMHNSQNNTNVSDNGPYGSLLKGINGTVSACVACHTDDATSGNGYANVTNAPLVDDDSGDFAAGSQLNATIGSGAWNGLHDLGADIATVAPGYDSSAVNRTGNLTCAGTAGCHGLRNTTDEAFSIRGSHHASNVTPDVKYRMLENVTGWGIRANSSNTKPNRTWGYNDTSHEFTHQYDDGISALCGECHGKFHTETGNSTSGFIRHPTDNVIPTSPAGRFEDIANIIQVPTGNMSNVSDLDSGNTVICQSCHFSHGSSYASILRFNYSTMNAGNGSSESGCEACHKSQR